MNAIDRDTILRLAGRAEWPSVSIFLPVDHLGIHTDADRIRLRNLVRDAHDQLVADGVKSAAADALLAGALAMAANEPLWAGGPKGLAVFADSKGVESFWLDTTMPEKAVVGDRLYLRPLYPALADESRAWALAIDSNKTRLFRIDRAGVVDMPLPEGTPISMADETKYDDGEESLQYHTVPGATPEGVSPGSNAAMFHGHGGSKDVDKVQRQRFMQDLSRGVVEVIGAQSSDALVLLGVDYMVEDFRATTAYSHVAAEQVIGATDYLSPADIQRSVLGVLAPRMDAAWAADVEEYRALTGTGRTSSEIGEVVAAAATGRVKTLIIDDSAGPWGYFDREDFTVTHLCPATPRFLRDSGGAPEGADVLDCGWDLVDLAATETLRHGGVVRAYRGEAAPIEGAVAVFRY